MVVSPGIFAVYHVLFVNSLYLTGWTIEIYNTTHGTGLVNNAPVPGTFLTLRNRCIYE
jgi:hypothetical protein